MKPAVLARRGRSNPISNEGVEGLIVQVNEVGGTEGGGGELSKKRKWGRNGFAKDGSCCSAGSKQRQEPAHVTSRIVIHKDRATQIRQEEGTDTFQVDDTLPNAETAHPNF